MHHHHTSDPVTPVGHHNPAPVTTTGRIIRWSVQYDWLVQIMALGRAGQLRKRMADLLPLQAGDSVLDIGCGTGELAFLLAQRVGATGKVVGIDPAAEMIDRARQKGRRRAPTIDFQVAAAEALPLPARSFDFVVSTLVFHHLPTSALKSSALDSIARVLKPGGQLIIVDFLHTSGHTLTHGGLPTDEQDLPTLLHAAGLPVVRSGPFPFRVVGMPALGYLAAELPRQPTA